MYYVEMADALGWPQEDVFTSPENDPFGLADYLSNLVGAEYAAAHRVLLAVNPPLLVSPGTVTTTPEYMSRLIEAVSQTRAHKLAVRKQANKFIARPTTWANRGSLNPGILYKQAANGQLLANEVSSFLANKWGYHHSLIHQALCILNPPIQATDGFNWHLSPQWHAIVEKKILELVSERANKSTE